ncbi:MAG: TRAM domain-containing protein, partial [Deltaproteobacteria bacterium]|nr:TRAM domain-containing protein [Deltaproteobacteria bacterium]
RETKFDMLGIFSFSPETGTPAAKLRGRIAKEVIEDRADEIKEIQAQNSRALNRALVGKTVPVLVEGFSDETDLLLTGRTATMAPDVDGQVLINKGSAVVGEIVPIRITEAHAYDLVGGIERGY